MTKPKYKQNILNIPTEEIILQCRKEALNGSLEVAYETLRQLGIPEVYHYGVLDGDIAVITTNDNSIKLVDLKDVKRRLTGRD